nr:basic salivary proline-rich protein 4-like [Loxodonta africana]
MDIINPPQLEEREARSFINPGVKPSRRNPIRKSPVGPGLGHGSPLWICSGALHSAIPGDEPSGVAVAPSHGPRKTSGPVPRAALRLPRARAPAASLRASQPPTAPGPPQGPLCARERRALVQTQGLAAAPSLSTGRGRSVAGSADRQVCLHRKGRLLLSPGGERDRRPPALGHRPLCAQCGARSSKAPNRAVLPAARPPVSAPKAPCTLAQLPAQRLPDARKRISGQQSFFLNSWRRGLPGSRGTSVQEPEEAGVQGRRSPRHGIQGWPGRRCSSFFSTSICWRLL